MSATPDETKPRRGGYRHPSELSQEIDPVAEYVRVLSAHPAVQRPILFGSRAIGDNWPRSDVDMAVVFRKDGPMTWHEVSDTAEEARTLVSIDSVDYDEARGDFRREIDRHGKVVYERG